MKNKAIPFFAILSCFLTACEDKETDTLELDTDTDTDIDSGETGETGETLDPTEDGSLLVGGWTQTSSTSIGSNGDVHTVEYPEEDIDIFEGYGIIRTESSTNALFFDISTEETMHLTVSKSYSSSFSIDGVVIYSSSYGFSEVVADFDGSISGEIGFYAMDINGAELSCTLSSDVLSCEGDGFSTEYSKGATIPEDFETIVENYPSTPNYSKEECVDARITTTGMALEWGGFESVGNDVALTCTYSDGFPATDADDLVFTFEAPNDGCFAFDTTGTDFMHGIQLQSSCASEEIIGCSLSNHVEHGLSIGEEVLVVIDGASAPDQVFNLSINEIPFNPSINDVLPVDTSAIDTSGWTEEVDASCGIIGSAKTYLWTATATGTAVFNLLGSSFDTVMQVGEASCGVEGICNDDNPETFSLQSRVDIEVEAGIEYLIAVGGYDGDTGALVMNISITVGD